MSFRWQVNGSGAHRDQASDNEMLHTVVTFTLTEVDGGTRVAVVERGFVTADMSGAPPTSP